MNGQGTTMADAEWGLAGRRALLGGSENFQSSPALQQRDVNRILESRRALVGGSGHFRSSSSLIDLPSNMRKVESMSSCWKSLREARNKTVSTAHKQCLQLLREAEGGEQIPEFHLDRSESASETSSEYTARDDASDGSSARRRVRGKKFRCQLKRPNKPLQSNLATVHVHAGKVVFQWSQNFTNIPRSLELSAMNVLGAALAPDRAALKVSVLSTPSPPNNEGTSDLEVYELGPFEKGSTAEDCADLINKMADTVRPFPGNGTLWMIVNPVSGHRKGEEYYNRVKPLFDAANVHFEKIIMTTGANHATQEITSASSAEFAECRGIVCIGGDGTVSEVLNALMARRDREEVLKRVAIGTIPAGSECAFAKMVSYVNPVSAAWVILKGHKIKAIDVLKIHQASRDKVLYSICGCGWGLAGKMAEDSEAMRSTYGPARYLVSGLKSFVNLRGCPGTLKVLKSRSPPQECFQPCPFASLCAVCETAARRNNDTPPLNQEEEEWEVEHGEGGFVVVAMLKSEKALAPYVHLSDGYVDVLSVGKVGRLELLRRSSKILTASHITPDQEFCKYWKAKSVILRPHNSDDKINVDGEVLDGKEIRVDVVPSVLNVFCAYDKRAQRSSATVWGDGTDWLLPVSPPF